MYAKQGIEMGPGLGRKLNLYWFMTRVRNKHKGSLDFRGTEIPTLKLKFLRNLVNNWGFFS